MKINPNYMANLKEKGKQSPDFKYDWQVLAHEMSEKFGTQMYSFFYKYPENKIREAYRICCEKNILKVAYLIAIIAKL